MHSAEYVRILSLRGGASALTKSVDCAVRSSNNAGARYAIYVLYYLLRIKKRLHTVQEGGAKYFILTETRDSHFWRSLLQKAD